MAVPEPAGRLAALHASRPGSRPSLSWDRVGVGSIEKMFEEMLHSFTDDEPPFDLVCTDEVMLRRFAAEGRVLVLNELMARDGITLDDVTAATRARRDPRRSGPGPALRQRLEHALVPARPPGAARPAGAAELGRGQGRRRPAAGRRAPRRRRSEFYGFATRGAPGGGHAVWTVSSFVASFGAAWFDADGRPTAQSDAHEAALATYVDLLRAVAPPDQAQISFVELMRDFRAGRVGMILEVGMEYAHLFRGRPGARREVGRGAGPGGTRGPLCQPLLPALRDPEELEPSGRSLGARRSFCARRRSFWRTGRRRRRSRPRRSPFSTAPRSTAISAPICSRSRAPRGRSPSRSGPFRPSASRPAPSSAIARPGR